MKIQKAVVQYKDRDDIICMYGIVDDGTKEGKKLYFLGDDETKKFSNGNRVVTDALVEAVDPMIEPKHVGLIDKKGNVIIPLENRAIKPISDKMVLVEKATPISQSVIDAVEARKGPNGASGLVATSAAIKDAMNVKMGPEGRFIFNDQFSEATVCDIDGNNLIGDQYFSYVSVANDLLYLSTNVADSEIKEFSISKKEFIENKNETQIDVNTVGVDPQVVDNALANETGPVVEIPSATESAPAEAVPSEEVVPPLGFDDFFKTEGSTLPPDSVEVTDDNKEVMEMLHTAKMPAAEETKNIEEESKTEEFTPEIPLVDEAMASQELGENSVPAPLTPENHTLEENEQSEVVTPPVVDVAAELQNIQVSLDEGVHDDVIPEVVEGKEETPVAEVAPITEDAENAAPVVENVNEENVEAVVPIVEDTAEKTDDNQLEQNGSELAAVAIPEDRDSPIPEIVEKDNNESEQNTEVEENADVQEAPVEDVVQEEPVQDEVVDNNVDIPAIPEVVGDEDTKNDTVEADTSVVENEAEVAPVEAESQVEEPVQEVAEDNVIDSGVAPVADTAEVEVALPAVEPVKEEVQEVAPAVDDAPVTETHTPVIPTLDTSVVEAAPVHEVQPEDVASIVDKDANGILDSDEFVNKGLGIDSDDMSLDDILGKDTDLDLAFEHNTSSVEHTIGSNTIMDDVVKSMSELVRQNKDQKTTISSLQGKLSTAERQRDLVADKYREQARKLELVTSKLKSLDTLSTRLEGKIKEKDKAIERLQAEINKLHDQINGKQDLVDILRDAQQLLDSDYSDSYLSKVA